MVKQLIKAYSDTIKMVAPLSASSAFDLLLSKNMDAGVCFFIVKNQIQGDRQWIRKYLQKDSSYWCPPVHNAENKKQMMQYLEFRLKVLKYEDSNPIVKFFKKKPVWNSEKELN